MIKELSFDGPNRLSKLQSNLVGKVLTMKKILLPYKANIGIDLNKNKISQFWVGYHINKLATMPF